MNIAHHMVLHLRKLSNNPGEETRVVLGGLITHLAKSIYRNLPANVNFVGTETFITRDYIQHQLKWIRRNPADNIDYWQIKVAGKERNSVPLPNPQKMKIVPNSELYLLELEAEQEGEGPQPTQVYGRDRRQPPPTNIQYTFPGPFSYGQFPQPSFQPGEGSSSQPSFQPPPPPPQQWEMPEDLVTFMSDMRLGMQNAADERRNMTRRLDRIYYDNSVAQFPVYDDYMRRGYNHPSHLQPHFFLPPDGGYGSQGGAMVYGDFNLTPDYWTDTIFPPQTNPNAEGQDGQWFGEAPNIGSVPPEGGMMTGGGDMVRYVPNMGGGGYMGSTGNDFIQAEDDGDDGEDGEDDEGSGEEVD